MQEMLGEDMMDSEEEQEFDSVTGELIKYGDADSDLIEEGWIVPDDQFSDSEDQSSVTIRDGENEAEYELRRQQREIEREQKKHRHVAIKKLEDRMKAVFKLGRQMKPTIQHESRGTITDEYTAVSLLQSKDDLKFCPLPIPTNKDTFNCWKGLNVKEQPFDFRDHVLDVI